MQLEGRADWRVALHSQTCRAIKTNLHEKIIERKVQFATLFLLLKHYLGKSIT